MNASIQGEVLSVSGSKNGKMNFVSLLQREGRPVLVDVCYPSDKPVPKVGEKIGISVRVGIYRQEGEEPKLSVWLNSNGQK